MSIRPFAVIRSLAALAPIALLALAACTGAPESGDEATEGAETATAQQPLITGDGSCTLQQVCNQTCLSYGKQDCIQQCGSNYGDCFHACYMDYRGDCCDFYCY